MLQQTFQASVHAGGERLLVDERPFTGHQILILRIR